MDESPATYPLTEPEPDPPAGRTSLTVSRPESCPNCGQPLPNDDSIVCVKCGFDLRTVEIRTTAVGPAVEAPPPPRPLTRDGISFRVTAITAAVAVAIMLIAYLSGAAGLFPRQEGLFLGADYKFNLARPQAWARLFGLLSFIGQRAIFFLATYAAIAVQSHLKSAPMGNRTVAAAHIACIVCISGLLLLIALPHPGIEAAIELLGQAAIGALGLMTLFRFRPAEAVITLGITILALIILIGGAHLIAWIV
jgi:hypothetical protein